MLVNQAQKTARYSCQCINGKGDFHMKISSLSMEIHLYLLWVSKKKKKKHLLNSCSEYQEEEIRTVSNI